MNQEEQGYALFLENIAYTLRTPHGFALVLYLLQKSGAFIPCADEADYRLRVFLDDFFCDIEKAAPDMALRLFAQCRGLPL